LPGTECISVALIDTQAPPRALSLDAGPESGVGVSAGAHKLFSLATLASSVVTLNVMSPALNLFGPLGAMLRDTQRHLLEPPAGGFVGEPPNLVLLERDVLRPAASTAVLEYAMLEPRGDALDDARSAVRRLFHNRTLVQMAPPEAADLDAISLSARRRSAACPCTDASWRKLLWVSRWHSTSTRPRRWPPKCTIRCGRRPRRRLMRRCVRV